MPPTDHSPFALLCVVGLGLAVAGGINAWLAVRGRPSLAAAVAGAVAAVAAAWAVDPRLTGPTAAVAGGLLGLLVLSRLPAVRAAWRRAASPAGRWALAAAGGAALVGVGSGYDPVPPDDDADFWADVAFTGRVGPTHEAAVGLTDRGGRVPLHAPDAPASADEAGPVERRWLAAGWSGRVIRRGPPADGSNCHGWVFTGGRYTVAGRAVPLILADNGYAPVDPPRPGDLAIYRGADGEVTHTAVVRAVADDRTVLVEGKWGRLGVYLHPPEACPYGTAVTYYRSPRAGHRLREATAAEGG
jgi:hypothetical protein